MNFENLNISEDILRALEEMGFAETTPIQEQAIPKILEGGDLVGQAQTGTGKTCAYGIPAVELTDRSATSPQVLVLCPTRELASQVAEELRRLAKFTHGLRILAVYGGQNIENQISALKKKPQIIIGTPGRVMDHMRRRTLRFDDLKMLVLDEADEMLNMGFREDIDTILAGIPEEKQMLLFSATMAPEIMRLTETYQKNPTLVKIAREELTTELTEQYYIEVREASKIELLCRLVDVNGFSLCLVFCNTKRRVDQVTSHLQSRGYAADALHGDMKQHERERVMNKFRHGIAQILVATDVAARGIDVSGVQAVFNYDIPEDPEQYVHRIGRTGRAGNTGRAYSFVFGRDRNKLKEIMRYTHSVIERQKPPAIDEVEAVRVESAAEKVLSLVKSGAGERFLPVVGQILDELSPEPDEDGEFAAEYRADGGAPALEESPDGVPGDIPEGGAGREAAAERLAAVLFSLAFHELEEKTYQRADFDDEEFSYDSLNMTRMFINAGRTDGLKEADIVRSIASNTSLSGKLIGSIELHTNFSFVDIPEDYVEEVISSMKGFRMKGRGISFERASRKYRGGSSGRNKKGGRRKDDRQKSREKKPAQPFFFDIGGEMRETKSAPRKGTDAHRKRKEGSSSSKGRRRKSQKK